MINFKNIHIGQIIKKRCAEIDIKSHTICEHLQCTEKDIQETFISQSIDTSLLLQWSKLLEYDFFRIYTQHITLFTSYPKTPDSSSVGEQKPQPQYSKNIYTKEIIDFILDSVNSGLKTKKQIIEEYRIPKTTLYKWFKKYNTDE